MNNIEIEIEIDTHIFWRKNRSDDPIKAMVTWKEGYIVAIQDDKIKIGDYIGDIFSHEWHNLESLEIEVIT